MGVVSRYVFASIFIFFFISVCQYHSENISHNVDIKYSYFADEGHKALTERWLFVEGSLLEVWLRG